MTRSSQGRAPRSPLRSRILSLVFLSTLATALGASAVSMHSAYRFVRQRIDESYPIVLERSGARLRGWLDEGLEEIVGVARAGAGHLTRGRRSKRADAALARALEEALSQGSSFSALVALDAKGRVRATAGEGPERDGLLAALAPKDAMEWEPAELMQTVELQRELAGVAKAGLRNFAPQIAPPVPLASAPLHDAAGRQVGSVHGLFLRSGLAAQLEVDLLDGRARLLVVDSDGQVIAPPGGTGTQIVALPPRGPGGDSGVREFSAPDGSPKFGAAAPLGALGWTLLVEQTLGEVLAPLFSLLARTLLVDLAIFAVVVALALRLASSTVRPLHALADAARRIKAGALEVSISDGGADDEVGLLVRTFNDMVQQLAASQRENEQSKQMLEKQKALAQRANETNKQLSITDGLTKLHNHRFFQDQLTRDLARVNRTGEPLSILVADIDDFKKLNDSFGHAAGDECLVRIARIMGESIRDTDSLARYGGEEFVVVAIGTDRDGAAALGEKIRTAVAEAKFIIGESMRPVRVTLSIGVAQYEGSRKELFGNADEALYRAKAEGKNCVVAAEPAQD